MSKPITGRDVAALLHHIHQHNDETGQIIYPHFELVGVLIALGVPEKEAAQALFPIHAHYPEDELAVFYYEEMLDPVLKELGLPEPEWGASLSIEEWKKQREEA